MVVRPGLKRRHVVAVGQQRNVKKVTGLGATRAPQDITVVRNGCWGSQTAQQAATVAQQYSALPFGDEPFEIQCWHNGARYSCRPRRNVRPAYTSLACYRHASVRRNQSGMRIRPVIVIAAMNHAGYARYAMKTRGTRYRGCYASRRRQSSPACQAKYNVRDEQRRQRIYKRKDWIGEGWERDPTIILFHYCHYYCHCYWLVFGCHYHIIIHIAIIVIMVISLFC